MRILTAFFLFSLSPLTTAIWGPNCPGSIPPRSTTASILATTSINSRAARGSANPIPADQSRWGRFDALQDRNREVLHKILEAAAVVKPGRTALEQKMGDYYASCMDQAAINAKGAAPLKPDLDRIAAMKDKAGLTDAVVALYRNGRSPFFRLAPGRIQRTRRCDRGPGSGRFGFAGSRLLFEDG